MKSFADALKKRVRTENKGNISLDFYTVKKATEDVLLDIFGKIGLQNIKVTFYKDGFVYLNIFKSVWKSEINLNRGLVISKIQEKLKTDKIKGLKVRN